MTIVRDLVTIDEHAEFRNDVQLSDYEKDETNKNLLKSYLFTSTAPQGQESSIGLLRAITESFLNPRLDNRITAIANYGHGKSHLALVLANYFGKSYQSDELKIIFNKIDQALDNPAQRNRFHEFRENRNEFLVIRLRGDKPQSLREQFVLCLEQGLKEHPATKNVELPFWYQKAEQLLVNLNGELLARANEYLETISMDVPLLIADVKNRKDNSYDICIKLFTELHGVAPNFQGEISQREMINWVSRNYCGDGKPLGGIFILFDEFSLYIQRYGQRNAAGELQDLLNGIEDQKGKSVFVAFAQHDPVVIARNTVKLTPSLESLEKELNRIPRKVPMYSLMESVINAYLKQPEAGWQNFRADPEVRGPIARASNTAMDLFSKRYDQILHWETEKFDEIVTKGCFPLHPLTTALLCDLRLQGVGNAGNPRTVLGFVFEQIHQKRDEPVVQNGKINWVLPIYLVDYFNEYLPETSYLLFENALRNLLPDAPEEQKNLLKALLLQDIARLPVRRDTQTEYLAEASGIKFGEAETNLRKLAEARVIRHDQSTHLYSFYAVSANPHRMEEIIDERFSGNNVTWELLNKFNNEQMQAIPVDVPWGNADDWAADEKIFTLQFFTPQRLRELIPDYHLTTSGDLVDGKRGCVIWLLGETDEEVNLLRQNAVKTLDEAFPAENPPAIILILPKRPCPEIISTYIKNQIVDKFSQEDRKEVGTEIYDQEVTRLKQHMVNQLAGLRGDTINYRSLLHSNSRYVVPSNYRAGMQTQGEISLNRTLEELYKVVYRFSPPEFFKEFPVNGRGMNNLRNATRSVANVLLRNSMPGNREAIFAQPIAKRLCETFLLQKWQLFTTDYRIQESGNSRILQAWNYLEDTFPAGVKEKKVKDILIKLLNPPYGFDYNTVTILFSAWVGMHSHDLQVCLQNRLVSIDKLSELLEGSNNSKQFISQISSEYHLAITRRDSFQLEREIQDIIRKANLESFTQKEAQDSITKLEEFCRDQSPDVTICGAAEQTALNLKTELTRAQEYDKQANEILSCIKNEQSILDVLSYHQKLSNLNRPTMVLQTAPQESDIHEKWLERITQLVEQECKNREAVIRITDIGLNQQKLQDLKNHLNKVNLANLSKRVESSLKILTEKQKGFEAREFEAPIQTEIRTMDVKANLNTLYEYQNRLKQITKTSAETSTLRNEKLRLIEQEITNLELLVKQLSEAIERIDTLELINEWRRKYYRNYDRYTGTSLQSDLEKADQKVENLMKFFQSLEMFNKRTPSSPQEAKDLLNELNNLTKSIKLSENQTSAVEKAQKRIEAIIQKETQSAKSWYQAVVYECNQGKSLLAVREQIKTIPAFLPTEERTGIEVLQQEVGEKIENDIVDSIEAKFREIKEPAIRQKCLKRLQSIVD